MIHTMVSSESDPTERFPSVIPVEVLIPMLLLLYILADVAWRPSVVYAASLFGKTITPLEASNGVSAFLLPVLLAIVFRWVKK
ncbi:MAG: hypothetical protein ABA06_03225 [Parcubacteria bacterium C7867-001]|nr:MAG: hypothetical protein ABA06_03225 [Parcubacteria bacterium C7867-001]